MKSWPLSVGPGFGTKSGCQILLEGTLTCQVLESIGSGINTLSMRTDWSKNTLTPQSHRNCPVQCRKVFWIAMDQSSLNGPLHGREAYVLSFFLNPSYVFSGFSFSSFPTHQKGFSPVNRRYLSTQTA